jgi:hypothetical protein
LENLLDNSVQTYQNLQLDDESIAYLNETRKWSMFLSILGFVFIGLLLVVGLVVISIGSSFSSGMGAAYGGIMFIVYLIFGIIYFFPIYYLFMFSKNMKLAITDKDSMSLTVAHRYLKSHYKFMGILAIVVISLYLIIILGALATGGFMALMH